MVVEPSEVMIIADKTADSEMLALDLVAQAEHGPNSTCNHVLKNSNKNQEVQKEINNCFDLIFTVLLL